MNADLVEAMVLGGGLLGGGGGGSIALGRRLSRLALETGEPRLVSLDELRDDDLLATVSMVGAPAASEAFVAPTDFVRTVELLRERLDRDLAGLITSENGGTATVNGLIQSAALGLPVVDAPCNGRAHPTGVMGSMALGKAPGYISRQAAAGGKPERRVELYLEAPLPRADALVRHAVVEAGGMVAVARNPVTACYVRAHGAPRAIAMAVRAGRVLVEGQRSTLRGREVGERLAAEFGGRVIADGAVTELTLDTRGGYDVGCLAVGDVELTFWNEYMTAERRGERLGTFPDLIATLDDEAAMPVPSAELQLGQRVAVLWVPRQHLILGAGMRDPDHFRVIEQAIGQEIVRYVF